MAGKREESRLNAADQYAQDLESCSQLVNILACKFSGRGVAYKDLVVVGNTALDGLERRFDASKRTRFYTFAFNRILGAMQDRIRQELRGRGITRSTEDEHRRVSKAEGMLGNELGRLPTDQEIADQLGIEDVVTISASRCTNHGHLRLDSPREPDGHEDDKEVDLLDSLASPKPLPDKVIEWREAVSEIDVLARAVLTTREWFAFTAYFRFGLGQSEIGSLIGGLSEYTVSEIIRRSKRIMRIALGSMEAAADRERNLEPIPQMVVERQDREKREQRRKGGPNPFLREIAKGLELRFGSDGQEEGG